ncbi:unnamed protein product [Bursaphelenchus xylophilus]|uniref:(pine wood nematode) hypothetical protein n=1 Tax=Bursaphelenchus xylophilus TaxID=6326 RepID=A0A1I7SFQ0_BURXY|nr:unnamed protein product [Bursaphelenchus xylophilus]CAG9131896.1 unnamed protein product [Bursaphelenchus xylophilus]
MRGAAAAKPVRKVRVGLASGREEEWLGGEKGRALSFARRRRIHVDYGLLHPLAELDGKRGEMAAAPKVVCRSPEALARICRCIRPTKRWGGRKQAAAE